MSKSIADRLREARELIERGWCQYWDALNADGMAVYPNSDSAVAWCMGGACQRVGLHEGVFESFLIRAVGSSPSWTNEWPYLDFNDAPGRTKAEVLAAFDRAIALAEGAPQ